MHKQHGQRFHFRLAGAVTSILTRPHALRLAAILVVFLPLSIGPAIWLGPTLGSSPEFLSKVYRPMLWLRHRAPDEVKTLFDGYLDSWSADAASDLLFYHVLWEIGGLPIIESYDGNQSISE